MIVVTFEVEFFKNKKSEYFKLVQHLQKELEKQKGLISVERFLHHKDTNKLLSFQFWDSESSVLKWKNNLEDWEVCLADYLCGKNMEKLGYEKEDTSNLIRLLK